MTTRTVFGFTVTTEPLQPDENGYKRPPAPEVLGVATIQMADIREMLAHDSEYQRATSEWIRNGRWERSYERAIISAKCMKELEGLLKQNDSPGPVTYEDVIKTFMRYPMMIDHMVDPTRHFNHIAVEARWECLFTRDNDAGGSYSIKVKTGVTCAETVIKSFAVSIGVKAGIKLGSLSAGLTKTFTKSTSTERSISLTEEKEVTESFTVPKSKFAQLYQLTIIFTPSYYGMPIKHYTENYASGHYPMD